MLAVRVSPPAIKQCRSPLAAAADSITDREAARGCLHVAAVGAAATCTELSGGACHTNRYIVETYLLKPWTMADVEQMALFYKQHMAPQFTQYPWPRELFEKFVNECNGSVASVPLPPSPSLSLPVFAV
jgi:hypothetical protein